MIRRPPRATLPDTPFPDTTLCRSEVDAALRHARYDEAGEPGLFGTGGDGSAIRTQRRHITPRSPMQAAYLRAMRDHDLVFGLRSEEHPSELQSLMRISYAVFCLKKKNYTLHSTSSDHITSGH